MPNPSAVRAKPLSPSLFDRDHNFDVSAPASEHRNHFYDDHAEPYAKRTLEAPMLPLLEALIGRLKPGARVLDLGCGAGRDLAILKSAGFDAIGVDLSPKLAAVARRVSGAPVIVGDMRQVVFQAGEFDAVIAVASLLHMTPWELAGQLERIFDWLTTGGTLLATFKIGQGVEAMSDGRLFTYVDPNSLAVDLRRIGFAELELDISDGSQFATSDHAWLVAPWMSAA